MIGEAPFNRQEKNLLGLGLIVLVFAYFYHLGIYPLFQEEPRRGIIALEMMIHDNYWVPTQTGDLYLRKPPVYNWLLIVAYQLFGEPSELATRFFSVLSHLVMSALLYVFVRKQLGRSIAGLSALSFLVLADILVSASTLGEIDLFYTLVTASSIFLIYELGQKRKYLMLFLAVYALTAIGFLTKGLSSLPFTAISLLVYFIAERQFKVLLGWKHIAGIALFVLISGGYFYGYSYHQDPSGWMTTLFSESADKAAGGGFGKFIEHFFKFPFKIWTNVLPAGLFLFLLFQKGAVKRIKQNKFVWFCALAFFSNFLVYVLSVEGRSRYVYPVFPFLLVVLVFLAVKMPRPFWDKALRILTWFCLVVLTIATPASLFLESLSVVDHLWIILLIIMLMIAGLWYAMIGRKVRPILVLYAMMTILKFGMSAIVPVTRQKATGAAEDKALAMEMVEITGDEPIYRYKDLRMSLTIVFYLEREKWDLIRSTEKVEAGYYVCYPEDLKDFQGAKILKEFTYFGSFPMYFIEYRP